MHGMKKQSKLINNDHIIVTDRINSCSAHRQLKRNRHTLSMTTASIQLSDQDGNKKLIQNSSQQTNHKKKYTNSSLSIFKTKISNNNSFRSRSDFQQRKSVPINRKVYKKQLAKQGWKQISKIKSVPWKSTNTQNSSQWKPNKQQYTQQKRTPTSTKKRRPYSSRKNSKRNDASFNRSARKKSHKQNITAISKIKLIRNRKNGTMKLYERFKKTKTYKNSTLKKPF